MFGHIRGSFTSAQEDKIGKFQKADGGTLFLDEVGDMSLRTQSKVLRSLDEDIALDKRKNHTIEVVVDRLLVKPGIEKRLEASIDTATKLANGLPAQAHRKAA